MLLISLWKISKSLSLWRHVENKELFLKGEITANIHRRLVNVYRKGALEVSTVNRLISRVNSNSREKGETELVTGSIMAGQLLLSMRIRPNTADILIKTKKIIDLCKPSNNSL